MDRWDTSVLVAAAAHVTATDIPGSSFDRARKAAPAATFLHHDLRKPFPFADRSFGAVVASLSLHYFDWCTTLAIVSEIRRCLEPRGAVVCRVNSVRDFNSGAGTGREIEPNFFDTVGKYSNYKRFFDGPSVRAMFGEGCGWIALEEKTIDRYDLPKVVWEAVLRVDPPA